MVSFDLEIEALVARARRGDQAAIEQLLTQFRGRLRRMIAMRIDERLSARIDPSDVVQEALAAAYQRLPDYLENMVVPFYVWLRQIAWDRLVDLHRHHILASKRSVDREDPIGLCNTSVFQLAKEFMTDGNSPVNQLIFKDTCARLHTALAQLSPRHREVLILRHVEQLSMAECGAVLEITENATKQLHLRAVRQLHLLLSGGMSGEPE